MENEETVEISVKEYERLKERDAVLSCLEMAGVDNWSGYGERWDFLKEYYPEEYERMMY